MQDTRPFGMPAASPAATMTRTASAVQFFADGCGATTTALRALTPIRILKIAVEVGFVDGVSAHSTPTGAPTSMIFLASSRRRTPHVGTSLIESHTPCAANSFLSCLCAGYPKPVSSWASWPRRPASRMAAATIASQIRSTWAWEANWNERIASRAATARSRACWMDRRSASMVLAFIAIPVSTSSGGPPPRARRPGRRRTRRGRRSANRSASRPRSSSRSAARSRSKRTRRPP